MSSRVEHPSFFKVVIAMDHKKLLRLPPAVTKKYDLAKNVRLKSHSGRTWKVKVEKVGNGQFCFTKGWRNFAEESALQLGDFVVFSELTKSEFIVEIYKTDFCRRQINEAAAASSSSSSNEAVGSEDQTPSFIMFRLRECSSEFCIPAKFVAKHEQVKELETMVLKTDDGKSWEMKIEKDKNGNCYMKDGWPEFMSENKIDDLDFLVFRLVGKATFKVMIYRADGCLKEPTSPTLISEKGDEEDEISTERRRKGRPGKKRGTSDSPLYFEKPLMMHHVSRYPLPADFSRAANMKEKTLLTMEFLPTGHSETVTVDHRPQKDRFDLLTGWSEFRVANKLEYGKIYSFEFKPDEDVVYVKEVIKK